MIFICHPLFKVFALAIALAAAGATLHAHGDKGNIEGSSGGGPSGSLDFPSSGLVVLSHLALRDIGGDGNGSRGNDIWGWTDPQSGKEYVLMGRSDGVAFIDISVPTNPIYLGILPKTAGSQTTIWRDVKVYENHAYIVADNSVSGLQIFDLTQLREHAGVPKTFSETARYDGFDMAHNIAINEATGFAYLVGAYKNGARHWGGGLAFFDLKKSPSEAGFAVDGYSDDGYTHDTQVVVYNGPDERFQGNEIAFNSNEDTLTIVDVTDKAQPTLLSRTTYSTASYMHQGWLTEDHKYFLSNDELDEREDPNTTNTSTHIWNVSNLRAPQYIGRHQHGGATIDHNLYIHDGLVFEANYTSGLRILNTKNLDNAELEEIAWIDTHPSDDLLEFQGAWSVYPFFESGSIVIGDINEGLIIVRLMGPSFEELVAAWRSEHFSPDQLADSTLEASLWGLDADPDDDGLNNFLEFAFDSNPKANVPGDGPQVALERLPDPTDSRRFQTFVTYTFVRRTDSTELLYRPKSSPQPQTEIWEEDLMVARVEPGNSPASERVTYRSAQPIDSNAGPAALFIQLQVDLIPSPAGD